jgi:membrane protein YdbS with pleckstrin-like domain
VRWGIVGIVLVLVVVGMVLLPPIRYRVFWYALSATDIDIQHGIIFIKRTVVPMHRVQNLRTERGPMADHYRMTNLKITTAAGSVTISGLDRGEADQLCDQISRLADVADDV